MATFYIDPSFSVDGDGSTTTEAASPGGAGAFNTWASVTFAAGNTYLQKRGIASVYTAAAVNINATGTSGNPITLGVYGSGTDRAYINIAAANCILANGREYIEISDFDLESGTNNGIVIYTNATDGARGVRITNCYAHDCGQMGIGVVELPNNASYLDVSDCIIDQCDAGDNGNHGIALTGALTDGAIIRNSRAWNNGLIQNAWGIYMRGRGKSFTSSNWVASPNSSYEIDITGDPGLGANDADQVESVVCGRRTGAGSTNDIFLTTKGTFDALNLNEFGQDGTTLQIRIGEDPNTQKIIFTTEESNGGIIEDCEAWGHTDTVADGVGIGHDNSTTNATIRRCYSHDNAVAGFQLHFNRNTRIESCIAKDNGDNGFQIEGTSKVSGEECKIINCVADGNTNGGFSAGRAPKGQVYNCIGINNGDTIDIDGVSVGFDYKNNGWFGNTSSTNTDATDILTDPSLNSGYVPSADSPLINAGKFVSFWTKDYAGNKFYVPPTIGAYEINVPSQYPMIEYE